MNDAGLMIFTGTDFLFRFLPAFLAVYYIAGQKHKSKVLFAGSLLFYAMGSPLWAPVLLVFTIINACFANMTAGKLLSQLMVTAAIDLSESFF